MDVGSLLREEGKEKTGHLDHTLHLIGDLNNLHEQLLQAPAGEHYRELYARLQPELPRLRQLIGRQEISDTELAFRTLYAAMLYRMKGDKTKESSISDVIELVSPVIGELARIFFIWPKSASWIFGKGTTADSGHRTTAVLPGISLPVARPAESPETSLSINPASPAGAAFIYMMPEGSVLLHGNEIFCRNDQHLPLLSMAGIRKNRTRQGILPSDARYPAAAFRPAGQRAIRPERYWRRAR